MSRLVDYAALPAMLRDFGFGAVTFSYPARSLASSFLAWVQSSLIDFTVPPLHAAFDAVKAMSEEFPVLNPIASIEGMQRHLRREPQQFGCLAGSRYFYLDWQLQQHVGIAVRDGVRAAARAEIRQA